MVWCERTKRNRDIRISDLLLFANRSFLSIILNTLMGKPNIVSSIISLLVSHLKMLNRNNYGAKE